MIENRLIEIRKENKVTQTQLADAVLTTRQTIYLIEKGKVVPSLELAMKIAIFFNRSIEDIFSLKSKNQKIDRKIEEDLFKIF